MENFLLIICLILLSVYDVKERRIPNSLVVPVYLLGLIGLCRGRVSGVESFAGLFVLPLIILVLLKNTKYKIGMGDVKLISAIGFCLGFWNQVLAVFVGLLICLVYLFGRFIKNKKQKFSETIFLGPFISFGVLFTLIISKIIVK